MAKKKKAPMGLREKFDKAYVEMKGKAAKDRAARGGCPSCGGKNCDCGCGK